MDWYNTKIGDIVELKRGYDLPSSRRKEGLVPIVSSSGISDYHNEFKKEGEGVITGRYGTLGKVYYVNGEYWPLNTTLYVKDFKGNNPKFIYYFLKVIGLERFNGAAAVPGLDRNVIHKVFVKFPKNKTTQTKIANILSAYDDLIENNNQRIKLLEEMAEEIYKEWFVRFRFPNYKNSKFFDKDGKEVKHGSLGALPEGWEDKRIKEISKVITGKTPSKLNEANFNGDIPFIKTPDMHQGMFFINTEETLSELGANSQNSQYIPENSISVSCIGTVGKVGVTIKESQTNQQINSIIPIANSLVEYLYFSLKKIKPIIESYAATGATMANLSKSKFENLKILTPNEYLIVSFHKLIEPIFEEIKILMQKNQVLQETRDLLLPRLISGKLSVEDMEITNDELEMVNYSDNQNQSSSAELSRSIAAEPKAEYTSK